MSRAYSLRSQIKTRLAAVVPGLSADQIIIERRKGLNEMIQTATAAFENGVAVTIEPVAGDVIDPDNEELYTQCDLVVSMWANPILAGDLDEQPEEEIHEDIMDALHHFACAVHDQTGRDAWQKLKVLRWAEVDDPDYLRRDTVIRAELVI